MTADLFDNTKDMLDTIITATGGENSPFEIFTNGNGILYYFCSWGKYKEDHWWSKGAWAIFFNMDRPNKENLVSQSH
jgi:hypothetical protein